MSTDEDIVRVTSKGQATIPKRFREKLHIETPGRVRFVENERGEVVVKPVPRPSEIQGMLREEDKEAPTEVLKRERERDKEQSERRVKEHEEREK